MLKNAVPPYTEQPGLGVARDASTPGKLKSPNATIAAKTNPAVSHEQRTRRTQLFCFGALAARSSEQFGLSTFGTSQEKKNSGSTSRDTRHEIGFG
jgi:hypothetical protein